MDITEPGAGSGLDQLDQLLRGEDVAVEGQLLGLEVAAAAVAPAEVGDVALGGGLVGGVVTLLPTPI